MRLIQLFKRRGGPGFKSSPAAPERRSHETHSEGGFSGVDLDVGSAGGSASLGGPGEFRRGCRSRQRRFLCLRAGQRVQARRVRPSGPLRASAGLFRAAACGLCAAADLWSAAAGGAERLLGGARAACLGGGVLDRNRRCVRASLQDVAAGALGDPPHPRVGAVRAG